MPLEVGKNLVLLKFKPQFHWSSTEQKELSPTDASLDFKVLDSDIIVIGGLFQVKEISSETKVPLVGDLPVLGTFFKGHRNSVEKTEFVIFLTPKIIVQ
jgi:type II secretory pathway component GspD/PulD (secretin)